MTSCLLQTGTNQLTNPDCIAHICDIAQRFLFYFITELVLKIPET